MTCYTCPAEGCDYGKREDKTVNSVRSHINAMSDPPHADKAALRAALKGVGSAGSNDTASDEQGEGVKEQAESAETTENESTDEGDGSDPSDDSTESDDMATDDEYQQQQARTGGSTGTESTDSNPSDGSASGGAGAAAGAAATGALGGLAAGVSGWVVVGIVALALLAMLLCAGGDEDSTPTTEGREPDATGEESSDKGAAEGAVQGGGGLIADGETE